VVELGTGEQTTSAAWKWRLGNHTAAVIDWLLSRHENGSTGPEKARPPKKKHGGLQNLRACQSQIPLRRWNAFKERLLLAPTPEHQASFSNHHALSVFEFGEIEGVW
jgi:hypothetical protein